MHELSITEALIDQIRRQNPPGMIVLRARIEIGARQSIEESSLRLAWDALTPATDLDGAALDLVFLPWTLTCTKCHHTWNTTDPLERCTTCGSDKTRAEGSNDLRLLSLEVQQNPERERGPVHRRTPGTSPRRRPQTAVPHQAPTIGDQP